MNLEVIKSKINNIFELIYKYRIALCFLLFFILVFFKLHGSSIEIYNDYIQPGSNTSQYSKPILGTAKSIRMDEYGIHTPISLSQKYTNYNIENNIIRAEKTNVATVYNQPIKAPFEIIKPFYWGYLIAGDEYGLSWYWNGRLIFLFLVTFEFFMIITRRNKLLSLLGSFLIVYSPPIQWWFSTDLIEEIFWCELGIISIYNFIKTDKIAIKSLLSVVTGLCMAGFTLCLYPAWILPFSYTFIAILIWIIYENKNEYKFKKIDLIYLLVSIILAVSIVLSVIIPSQEALTSLANTVHPGQRRDFGGEYLLNLFYYLINYKVYPLSNPCELSHFIGLFPLPAIITCLYLYKTKFKDKLCIGLLIVQAIIIAYLAIGFTPFIAKITGFMMTTYRAAVVSSFIDIILLLRLLSNTDDIKFNFKPLISFIYSVIVFIGVTFIKTETLGIEPEIISNKLFNVYPYLIALIAFIVSYIVLLAIEKNSKLKTYSIITVMILSFLCFSLVNPVMHGLDTIYKIPVGNEINRIQTQEPGRWLVVDTYPITNFPAIFGAPTINYTNIYPNLKLWHLIDKENKYADVYNRYCNISVILMDSSHTTSFETLIPESIILYLSVDDLPKLNVNYIFSTIMTIQHVKLHNGIELTPIYDENGAKIYKVIYSDNALKIYNEYKNQIS